MHECLVQRINLEFINTKATGYCKTLKKETLQQHWSLPNKKGKVKVHSCTGAEALSGRTAHGGSRGIALLFLDHGTRRGWGFSLHPGHSLPLGKTRHLLYKRLGGPQGQSGQMQKISIHQDSLLYWLCYLA
jgi:hypothetical protein